MLHHLILFLKGLSIGAANVVPGVSGGTLALITGMLEPLVESLRRIGSPSPWRLLLRGRWAQAWTEINGAFLCVLGAGMAAGILTLARLFEWMLAHHPVYLLSYFFGLILVSIPYVGREITSWSPLTLGFLLLGIVIAAGVAFLLPLGENPAPPYVFLCGVLAICAMILPGLSGSFVLMLMGNYALVLGAINDFQFAVLLPFALGAGLGLLAFAQVLGWVFRRFHNPTLGLMLGFVVGSMVAIWPWKVELTRPITVGGETRDLLIGYQWQAPPFDQLSTLFACLALLLGGLTLFLVETLASRHPATPPKNAHP